MSTRVPSPHLVRAAILHGAVSLFLVALGTLPATLPAQVPRAGEIINQPITVRGKQWDLVVKAASRPADRKGLFLNGAPVTFDSAHRSTIDVPGAGPVQLSKKGGDLEIQIAANRISFTMSSQNLDIDLLSPSPLTETVESLKTQLSSLKMKLHEFSTTPSDSVAAVERRVQSRLDSVQTLIGAIASDMNAPR